MRDYSKMSFIYSHNNFYLFIVTNRYMMYITTDNDINDIIQQ